jgi:hypothetical protein
VRKSRRRQNPPVHGKAHRYRTTHKPDNSYEDEATVERHRLEQALRGQCGALRYYHGRSGRYFLQYFIRGGRDFSGLGSQTPAKWALCLPRQRSQNCEGAQAEKSGGPE